MGPFRPKLAVNPCTSPWRAKQSMSERLGPADCPAPSRSRFLSDAPARCTPLLLSHSRSLFVEACVRCARAAVYSCCRLLGARLGPRGGGGRTRIQVAGQAVDVGASRAGRLP